MAKSAQVKKVSNWNQALSDFMIAQPQARAYEVAEFFGVSEAWLSVVKNSDAFKEFHNRRRETHFDRVSGDVSDKLTAIAEMTLDELSDRIESERETIPLNALQSMGKMALDAMGFGQKGSVHVNMNNDNRTVVVNDAKALERSRQRLKQIREANDEVVVADRLKAVSTS